MTAPAFTTTNLGAIVLRDAPCGGYFDQATGIMHSASELDDRAARVTAAARAEGWRRGQTVAILAENGPAFTAAYLGLMRAGLVVAPLSYRMPRDTIEYMAKDCAAVAVLAGDALRELAPRGLRTLDIAELGDRRDPDGDVAEMGADEIAEILYTSGSTGRPKGVPLTHHGQLWALRRFLEVSSIAPERTVIAAPAYHMNGLFFTTVTLALGWYTVSMPKFEAKNYLQAAAQHGCTTLSGIPTMFAMMAREEELLAELDLNSVKDVIIGSAPLTQALVDRVKAIFPNAGVRNSYGTTETGPAMFGPHPKALPRPPLSIGYPYPDVEWRLVGSGAPEEGELETRTPATLRGYLNLPKVSASRLEDGWYKTGDVLRRDAQGFFYFVGRADDMFVCGGENVYPGEVEKLLERHQDVLQAAVVAVEDEIKGAIPVAFVTRAPGARVNADALRQFALEHGPAFSHPRAVLFVDALPVGGTHKVDKSALMSAAKQAVKSLGR